jgi:Tfp pilus assembly protein PilV
MRRLFPWNSTKQSHRVRRFPIKDSEAGFTLIEMLVSSLLIVAIGAAVAQALVASAYLSGDQRRRSEAAQIAQQDQERLRGLSVAQLNSLNQVAPRSVAVAGSTFTVSSTSQFLDTTGGPSCNPGAAAYFKIVSTVNWASNARKPVTTESIVAPPAGGTIRAQVQDETGSPLPNVTVSANGPDVESASTDSAGCAILSGLPSGSYALTYSLAGYVDRNGASPLTGINATVSSTGNSIPSTNPVVMGKAGYVTAVFGIPAGTTTWPGGEADYLSWYGAGSGASMASPKSLPSTSPAPVAPSLSTGGLFPFIFTPGGYASNYQIWAGKCVQMEPPAGVDKFTVGPGSSQTFTVQEPELDLFVLKAGVRVKPDHVKITYTSTSGSPSCTDTWQPTVASNADTNARGALANPGQPFATSTANLSASGYTGTMAVCADAGGLRNTISSVTDSFAAPTTVNLDVKGSGSSAGTC